MIEFGLPLRGQQHTQCMQAFYQSFSHQWGKSDNGFAKLPKAIDGLEPKLTRKSKFLGGFYELDIQIAYKTKASHDWSIDFYQPLGRKACFKSAKNTEETDQLVALLNKESKLIATLDKLDLVGVSIEKQTDTITLKITPIGGGICFLAIPPVRYTVPLPKQQIKPMAWCIEKMGKILYKKLQ